MLMVIFGAGASYDSYSSRRPTNAPIHEYDLVDSARPPLANQLFSNRVKFIETVQSYPACIPIIPFVRHFPTDSSVEKVLEGLQEEANDNPRRHAQLAAVRHYIRSILLDCEHEWATIHKGVTNYHTLLDEIEGWRRKRDEQVCLVTFNYDTMLDRALPIVGVNIATLGEYVSQHYKLIKPHGSVNWARQVVSPMNMSALSDWDVTNELIMKANAFTLTDEYRIVSSRPLGKSPERPLFPALAIPVISKQDYECPKPHLGVLDDCIARMTKLLVIGWRANEEHFLRRLAGGIKQALEVMVVSGSAEDAQKTINNLASTNMRVIGRFQKTEEGFSDFIVSRKVRGFLRS